MSDRYALVNQETNTVENVILWDGDTRNWTPPEGVIAILAPDEVGIGWKYEGGAWVAPVSE